ncbi:MAG: DEAD/DEAH box helicase [Thermosynechococcaceae cyanobacterium MS004]|nr:DEAD/DEAH box helicase [Thermosynechococcaceae cyanobacterium MS004]
MNNVTLNIDALRAELTEKYQKLQPLEQKIIQLFSVIYEPISRTNFVDCFNVLGIRDKNKNAFTAATLKPYIDKLINQSLLLQERTQGPQCHPLFVEIATRDALKTGTFEALVKAVETKHPVTQSWRNGPRRFTSERQFLREVRIGLYGQDIEYIEQQFEDYYKYGFPTEKITLSEVFLNVCNNPFDADWFQTLIPPLFESAIASILQSASCTLFPAEEAFELIQERSAQKNCSDFMHILLIEQCLMRGQLKLAEESLTRISAETQDLAGAFKGWLRVLQGQYTEAIQHYAIALKALRKLSGKRKAFFDDSSGLFYILALLKQGSPENLREAEEYATLVSKQPEHWLSYPYTLLKNVLQVQQGNLAIKDTLLKSDLPVLEVSDSLEVLICALCLYWVDLEVAKVRLPKILDELYQQAEAANYHWITMEAAELLSRLRPRGGYGKRAAELSQAEEIMPLATLIQPKEPWELCLNALAGLQSTPQAAPTGGALRLVWSIGLMGEYWEIQPREQKMGAKGAWSKGRNIALKRLSQTPGDFSYLTPQDLRVCQQIESGYTTYRYYGQVEYEFSEKAIVALIGHPLVFWEDSAVRVEIVKGEPELLVKKSKQNWLTLEFSPKISEHKTVLVIKETPTRLKVIEINDDHRRIAAIIGAKNRLEVPESAKDQVLSAINAVSGVVTVHSDIGGGVASAEEVPADTKPHVHLLPAGEGLKVAIMARPFTQGGPYFRPGAGGETVIAEIDGKRLQTTRNLKEEKKLADAVAAACPVLANYQKEDGEWLIEDPEDCLELLLDLQPLGDTVVMEWPEGEKMRVTHPAGLNSFRLNISSQQDWFAASGELQIGDDQVMDMQRLLELMERSPGRFLPLGDGQFLTLTQEFRKRLDELRTFSEKHGKGTRFHPLAALALEDFIDEVGDLTADKRWKDHVKRLKDMKSFQPEVPSTLQAELRDYQIEGFRWLARLAHWGVGACLADDMGLGKTLQSLALILTRAAAGPTLIVAPTSVGMNWINEAHRFAPTLNVVQFSSGDRQALLDNLQPFDMLVCTYGLLQQEELAEKLAQVEWQTIVLDEAQAIKNFATKRSKGAMSLQSGFKLLTTGTPIENHLGELWNLFRFINPGLLGSLDQFNQRFANPIERYQDKTARNQLKKLIQPFILRRTKSQVLQELPSRTEILLHVELSKEESALYEALRREAIAKLADSDAEAGAKHLQVLAEIMKLRRMCCNSRLVMAATPLPSSKLQLFGEVLTELLENRHKALVFSQFVDHLSLIREYLDEQKIQYQYLDGSTPVKDRKKRVDAFQSGEGDVFLISLKAGGTGLNLTAADYVIHMDPWWNPAVEDQASDRAHRIGQQRPVTIYRLVAKDTIEEKIVNLHQHKRDLADSLLEGTDMSGKISTDDLLKLIQEK